MAEAKRSVLAVISQMSAQRRSIASSNGLPLRSGPVASPAAQACCSRRVASRVVALVSCRVFSKRAHWPFTQELPWQARQTACSVRRRRSISAASMRNADANPPSSSVGSGWPLRLRITVVSGLMGCGWA